MNKKIIAFFMVTCFLISIVVSVMCMSPDQQFNTSDRVRLLGKLCVLQIYPAAKWEEQPGKETEVAEMKIRETTTVKKEIKEKADNSKPKIIIYHTHSSESYQPYSESNFHRQDEAGTVREVGSVMKEELNELGIGVVHDKTIHDSPSYNESYDRSMETITALMKKYPTAKVIIDLHRDAAAYTGNVGETMDIQGETVAKYKLVIGQSNDNYGQLKAFSEKINNAAESLYPGFSGRVIEKEYRYNEYISDKYLLLEVGNNQNDIKEVRKTGKYFAHVLAEVLEEE